MGGLRKTTENFNQERKLNPGPPEYEEQLLGHDLGFA